MTKLVEIMMQLIKSEICNLPLKQLPEDVLSVDFLTALYQYSKLHDLAHIVGHALEQNGLLPQNEIGEKFQKQTFTAVYRYQQLQYTYQKICDILENENIAYVPLKGSVIRRYYAEPWMRTSCDIDILVHEEDLEQAVKAISDTIGLTQPIHKNFHDISLFLSGNTHLELHHTIKESLQSMDCVLEQVWDHVYQSDEDTCQYLQTNEYLMFHIIAHTAYHFLNGGCGIRPIIDWWLLREHLRYNSEKLDELLQIANLKAFETQMTALSDVWFSNETHTPLTQEMENYILGAGVYGSLENHVAIFSGHANGRLRYFFKRVFPPYRLLKSTYPILKKYPILYPFYTVKRWFRILFGKNRSKALKETKYTTTISDEKTRHLTQLCEDLDLI